MLAPTSLRWVDKLAYRSQHLSFLVNATLAQEAARLFTRQPRPKVSPAILATLRDRVRELHATDLANVEAGLYPRELLFGMPVRDYARALPALLRDVPEIVRRKRARAYQEIPALDAADKDRFPPYYRRTFHWQTDGYLSAHSANIYDLGVELLFRGTADVMRRQVIPPISRFAAAAPDRPLRVLDVGCGTGRTLHQLAVAHPTARLHGIDLSPAYVQLARRRLADVAELTLAVGNGEALPWGAATFDVATSVYLFHELPRNARRNVVRELTRVVRPGGLIILEDSAQLADSPTLEPVLRNFPVEFHEPFYADYLEDDLAGLLAEAGLEVASSAPHLVAKVVVARRP